MTSSSRPHWHHFKELFAFNHAEIEQLVEDLPGHYKNLPPEALYTSTEDFYRILTSEYVSGDWVDLGAGVGESALMHGMLYPQRSAWALEKDLSRLKSGENLRQELGLSNVFYLGGDLLTLDIPDVETYFLYFPTGHVLDRILHELRAKTKFRQLIAIESHGDLLARLDKENWLKLKGEIPLTMPRHYPSARVYGAENATQATGPHSVSFLNKYLLIEEESGQKWIGDTFGLEWLKEDQYQLLHPPRTIEWKQVKGIMDFNDLLPWVQEWVTKRKQSSDIRKIYVAPMCFIELADGSRVLVE